MRHKDESKFKIIADEIKRFYIQHGRLPTQRELSKNVGLGQTATCSYIKVMKQKGLIEGAGRHIVTDETKLIAVPIVDSLADNKHIYDEATPQDYIFISKKPFGDGEFGIVRAIDDSMISANIRRDNLILIKRQKYAKSGQIVLAKVNGWYVLRRYICEGESQNAKLVEDNLINQCEDIYDFEIRGLAVNVIAGLNG